MEELNNIKKYQEDIERLISRGDILMMGLINELKDILGKNYEKLPKEQKEQISQYSFKDKYNEWYI